METERERLHGDLEKQNTNGIITIQDNIKMLCHSLLHIVNTLTILSLYALLLACGFL